MEGNNPDMDQQQQTYGRNVSAGTEEIEIDLLDLFSYYLSRFPLFIAAILIGAIIAGAYTVRFIPKNIIFIIFFLLIF